MLRRLTCGRHTDLSEDLAGAAQDRLRGVARRGPDLARTVATLGVNGLVKPSAMAAAVRGVRAMVDDGRWIAISAMSFGSQTPFMSVDLAAAPLPTLPAGLFASRAMVQAHLPLRDRPACVQHGYVRWNLDIVQKLVART